MGTVLFINADRDYREGRAQNYLEPDHVEKIVSAFRKYEDVPDFARVVRREELKENNDNLNIRRYVDTTPPPEPQDVRAHLYGGIPRVELKAKSELFIAHGLDMNRLFVSRDDDYVDFDHIGSRGEIKAFIEADSGVTGAELAVTNWIAHWWGAEEPRFDKLQSQADLVELRKEFMHTFHAASEATSLLDSFAISGVIASWWGKSLPDLKTLATIGYKGLVDAWVATVLDALDEEKSKVNPFEHKVARALVPEYLDSLANLQTEVSGLDSTVKAVTATDEDEVEEPDEISLSLTELKSLKSKLTAAKRKLRLEKAAFGTRLSEASDALADDSARVVVLKAMEHELFAEAGDRISRHRRRVIGAIETWWDKYERSMSALEHERAATTTRLASFLEELGYE